VDGTVAPASVAEAAELFTQATRERRTVSIGRPGGDVVLSTHRLDRVLEHEAGDLTVTVEAGVRLSALNARLAQEGQMLALDPPGDPTVGACLAANLSGPRRHRYGAPRDLVLGATVVLADGTVASSGGKVVKNVAGYDIAKLFCGSEGRYGLLARLSLRLHPLPAASASLVAALDEPGEARARSQLIQSSQLVPSALDLLWQGPGSRLQVLFEGSPRSVAAQLAEARLLVGGDEAGGEAWDEARAWQSRARGRISFPPRGLAQTLGTTGHALVRPGIGSAYPMEPLVDEGQASARLLADRVRAALDPQGVLA
jgi:glycolate oxidase FAD binding subunit